MHTSQRRHLTTSTPITLSSMSNLGELELVGMIMVVKAQSGQFCQYSTNLVMLLDDAKIDD